MYTDKTIQDVSVLNNDWTVVVTVSYGFIDMFENWLLYFCKLNITIPITVVAEDSQTYEIYHSATFLNVLNSSDQLTAKSAFKYESMDYKKTC